MTHANDSNSSTICIRPATAADYPAIAEIWRLANMPADRDSRDTPHAFAKQLQTFASSYLVAVDGDSIVGVVLGTHEQRKGWINRLAVHPSHRRRGIASMLVRACENALLSQGIPVLGALVERNNTASARLFAELGYSDAIAVHYFRKVNSSNDDRHCIC